MSTPATRPAYQPARKLLRPTGYNPGMKRPQTTVAGAVLVFLRVGAGILWGADLAMSWNRDAMGMMGDVDGLTASQAVTFGLVVIIVTAGVVLAVELVLGILILVGFNWPRVVVMFVSVVWISIAFVAWWLGDLEISVRTGLVATALDTLILLALSSRSAAAYARRNEQR